MTLHPRMLATDAATAVLTPDALNPADVVAGEPAVSSALLASEQGIDIGLWEITEGTVNDVESDEVFVVLTGRGRVVFDDGEVIELAPGAVVRLNAGERTTWTIHETLRKVYVLLPDPTPQKGPS